MRWHSIVVLATLTLGCLPAFAPNLRIRGPHAGLHAASPNEQCMGCHVSEREALQLGPDTPMAAPIVADWMLEDARTCGHCHRVHEPSARKPTGDHLPALAELDHAP